MKAVLCPLLCYGHAQASYVYSLYGNASVLLHSLLGFLLLSYEGVRHFSVYAWAWDSKHLLKSIRAHSDTSWRPHMHKSLLGYAQVGAYYPLLWLRLCVIFITLLLRTYIAMLMLSTCAVLLPLDCMLAVSRVSMLLVHAGWGSCTALPSECKSEHPSPSACCTLLIEEVPTSRTCSTHSVHACTDGTIGSTAPSSPSASLDNAAGEELSMSIYASDTADTNPFLCNIHPSGPTSSQHHTNTSSEHIPLVPAPTPRLHTSSPVFSQAQVLAWVDTLRDSPTSMAFMAAWTQNSFKVQTPATPFNSDHWVCVGVGGQGVVLMPRGHGIKYVAKVFYAQAGAIETFQREAYSYALLHLQAAVSGLPAGGPLMLGWAELPGGLSALLLEHAGGGTLQSHIKCLDDVVLTSCEPNACRLSDAAQMPTMCAALLGPVLAAHRAGVAHRDLKRAQMLLTAQGTPLLADFGTSQLTSAAALHAHAPTLLQRDSVNVVYSPPCSPEMLTTEAVGWSAACAAGMDATVKPEALDVFQLGLMFIEACVGNIGRVGPTVLKTAYRSAVRRMVDQLTAAAMLNEELHAHLSKQLSKYWGVVEGKGVMSCGAEQVYSALGSMVPESLRDLVSHMLCDTDQRWSLEQVASHAFLADVHQIVERDWHCTPLPGWQLLQSA